MEYAGEALAAVRRKLNVTWEDEATSARVRDAAASVSGPLAARLGLEQPHLFAPGEPGWALFLSACLYEFSDALDDFWKNYEQDITACRLMVLGAGEAGDA